MPESLHPYSEQYLQDLVDRGVFPTRAAALEAAVESLRVERQEIPLVPPEHMAAVEEGIRDAEAGQVEDWNLEEELRWLQEHSAKHPQG